jgi:hypothetical protein
VAASRSGAGMIEDPTKQNETGNYREVRDVAHSKWATLQGSIRPVSGVAAGAEPGGVLADGGDAPCLMRAGTLPGSNGTSVAPRP